MFIPDPDCYPSRIPDPNRATKQRGKKNLLPYLLCSHKFHNFKNYFSFEMLKKKMWANFQRIIALFTQKIVTELSKIWVWDRDLEKIYPGSRGQKGTGSRIRIRNTALKSQLSDLVPDPDQQRRREILLQV
jgi:hypothetical protein